MVDEPITFQIFKILKEFQKTESRFIFKKNSPEREFKNLRINFSKEYKNASNDSKKLLLCAEKAKKNIENFLKNHSNYFFKMPIWAKRKKILEELNKKFDVLITQLSKDQLKNDVNILDTKGLEDVNQIRGMEVFRTVIKHGVGVTEMLNFEYEIIVVLSGEMLDNKANKAIVETKKGCKTCKVADIKVKPPDLSLLPVLGKSIDGKLSKFNIDLRVYITFINILADASVSLLNIKNELPKGLLEEIKKK
ncbi:MAG: hypothetical protein LBJ32_02760 [Oscillospiraceae bacterium]|jgi:hypothetical protein|nr:hypothetical protein [Oscillospiraceae bacterium]